MSAFFFYKVLDFSVETCIVSRMKTIKVQPKAPVIFPSGLVLSNELVYPAHPSLLNPDMIWVHVSKGHHACISKSLVREVIYVEVTVENLVEVIPVSNNRLLVIATTILNVHEFA